MDENISKAQRRCALAHEIAHMDAGDTALIACYFSTRIETGADRTAARRLIDAHDLADVLRWAQDGREVAELLDVSPSFLALRWKWMAPYERALSWRSISRKEAVA